jgi:pimeloyl-ACP methyl ester carboxylesterase
MISEMVMVPAGEAVLTGDLVVPGPVRSVVLFAHGSGSSRHSTRSRAIAAELRGVGLGTLLLDLLNEREEREDAVTSEHRFDIPLLARRLVAAIDWLERQPETGGVPVGLFAAGTGVAAALSAAVERPERVYAVVSRGGRPDLAGEALERIRTPVLLIVGGNDAAALRLHREIAGRLSAPHKVHVVRGVARLFEESEALEQVATAARDWFLAPAVGQGSTRRSPGA